MKSKLKHLLTFFSSKKKPTYFLTRFLFLRMLGLVYVAAFASLVPQVLPLLGSNGLTPAHQFVDILTSRFGSTTNAFIKLPSLFWFNASDTALITFAIIGLILAIALLIGFANVPILLSLWFIYMSFIHVGQQWLSYGWETQLLETGFLALFLVPLLNPKPFSKLPPPLPIILLMRWLTFRIHLGAGLIKLRGAECWRDLTCLYHHYETQPIPGKLTPWFNILPKWFHKLSVALTHTVQTIVPWFSFFPKYARHIAGIVMIVFQFILILSGNLAFLNWVTLIPIIGLLDDSLLQKTFPKFIVAKAHHAQTHQKKNKYHTIICWTFFAIVLILSIPIVQNLASPNQKMNFSYNTLHIVNTYGAFGSITKQRNELVIAGTHDQTITPNTQWKEYEFIAKPTSLDRPLPNIAPYQPRIDWQIWFAAMGPPRQGTEWIAHFVWKLLHNDKQTLSLIKENPFPQNPPAHIKIDYYKYTLNPPLQKQRWSREYIGTWLPPLSKSNPQLKQMVATNNWKPEP